jgi:DNA end-binding protein Ku
MAARSIASGTISFGLVSIPVRLYVATSSQQASFNLLHEQCGTRIKQQLYCPVDERVIERSELVKGYQFQRDRYVRFTDAELRAVEAAASPTIDIHEFVPLDRVDPIYFENAHYLGPDKGGEKAYRLLSEAMRDTKRVALAQHVSHGKEHLVLIRPYDGGLVMHEMYYADEVRAFSEIPADGAVKLRDSETDLAKKLIEQLSAAEFRPDQYRDEYRERLMEAVEKKVAGEEIVAPPAPERAEVIDLMDALKKSLAGRKAGEEAGADERTSKRRPAAAVARREAAAAGRRAHKK